MRCSCNRISPFHRLRRKHIYLIQKWLNKFSRHWFIIYKPKSTHQCLKILYRSCIQKQEQHPFFPNIVLIKLISSMIVIPGKLLDILKCKIPNKASNFGKVKNDSRNLFSRQYPFFDFQFCHYNKKNYLLIKNCLSNWQY